MAEYRPDPFIRELGLVRSGIQGKLDAGFGLPVSLHIRKTGSALNFSGEGLIGIFAAKVTFGIIVKATYRSAFTRSIEPGRPIGMDANRIKRIVRGHAGGERRIATRWQADTFLVITR